MLVVVAMDVEEQAIIGDKQTTTTILSQRLGTSYKNLSVDHRSIKLLKSGVGAVNTALVLSHFLDQQTPDAIVMLGVGGALVSNLNIGDLVISENVVQHDSIFSGENLTELMAPGELFLSVDPRDRVQPVMAADPVLIQWLQDLSRQNREDDGKIFTGTILSGNEFVANSIRKTQLAQAHPGAMLVDMEASALAQICRKLEIPFVIAKTVANRLNPDGTISADYKGFLVAAANRAAQIMKLLLREH